jgi:hypothetical protein
MNLGRTDLADVAGLRRLAASINRHYGDSDGGDPSAEVGAAPLEVIDARTTGSVWPLERLWQRLGVAVAVRAATDARRFTTNGGLPQTWNGSCSRWSRTGRSRR